MTAPLYSKVPCKDEDDVSVSSDSLGEQLFELVDVYKTGHSQKITGKQPGLSINISYCAPKYQLDMKQLISNLHTLPSGYILFGYLLYDQSAN